MQNDIKTAFASAMSNSAVSDMQAQSRAQLERPLPPTPNISMVPGGKLCDLQRKLKVEREGKSSHEANKVYTPLATLFERAGRLGFDESGNLFDWQLSRGAWNPWTSWLSRSDSHSSFFSHPSPLGCCNTLAMRFTCSMQSDAFELCASDCTHRWRPAKLEEWENRSWCCNPWQIAIMRGPEVL